MIYYAKHTSSYLEMEINYKNINLIDMNIQSKGDVAYVDNVY